jgi:23S rRNA pseudouridine2457 synthase
MAFHYYKLYKPFGFLSQFTPDHPGQKTLSDLGAFPKDVYPVGRLDKDSEGLLILTNDNHFKSQLLDPASGHERTYLIQVEGSPGLIDLEPLNRGIEIRIKKKVHHCKPVKFKIHENAPSVPDRIPSVRFRKTVPDTWIQLTLTEGKNRQVRRMMAKLGFPVLRLIRIRMGSYSLGDLNPGEIQKMDN